jgi:hypothetical protein
LWTDQRADRVDAFSYSRVHGLLRGDAVSDNNRDICWSQPTIRYLAGCDDL